MMFQHRAVPYLRGLSDGVIASRTVKTFGIGESAAESVLRDLMNALHNPTLAPYAKPNGTELRITAHADTEAEALALIAPVEEQVKELMGHYVIWRRCGLPGSGLLLPVAGAGSDAGHGRVLHRRPHRQAHHGPAPVPLRSSGGASCPTPTRSRHHVLGVPQDLLDTYGAVSPQVAEAMARGAKQAAGL